MALRTSLNLVDITKNQYYERVTPYKCVISNLEHDFVCHTIFVISASDYFYTLYSSAEERCEIEPGLIVPRIRVNFTVNLIEEYIRFAYFSEMQITHQNVEGLLEFASYLNSVEMLTLVEKYLCELADSLPIEQLKEYFQVADNFQLEQFKSKLATRVSTSSTAMQVV